jgi:hypothetical protein
MHRLKVLPLEGDMSPFDCTPIQIYLRQWVRRQPYGWHQRRAQDIANEWMNDVAFADVQLARWLRSPDGEVIIAVVKTVLLPYPAHPAVALLVEAIQIAARQRTNKQIAMTAVGGLALAGLLYVGLQS